MGRSSQKKKKEDGEDRTRRTGRTKKRGGSVEEGGVSETQTGRDKALEKGKEDVLKLLRGKRSQEVKEKEGKRKSEENGNGVGGRVVSRGRWIRGGGRKQEESYNAAVVSVSCVPRAGSPDWSARAPGGTFIPRLVLLERDSFESEDPALIRIVWEQKMTRW